MKNKTFTFMLSAIIIIAAAALGAKKNEERNSVHKVTDNDDYEYIAINQILMWVSNNGDGSNEPVTDRSGFYWPGGINATKSAIFEDGLVWGAKIDTGTRVNGNTYRQGLQAGKILPDGTADDPSLPKYRVYKIRKDWQDLPPGPEKDEYEKDYNEWPVEDGAPWIDINGDGVFTKGIDEPEFIGDEVLWFVSNDLDACRTTRTYGSYPIGLEVQTTVFGFNRTGDLGDVVFKKYLVINKGTNTIEDMVFGYWSDTDLGYANDDYSGCDTVLSLAYTYNGTNEDNVYGTPPPAVGYDFIQGPIVQGSPTDSAMFLGKWINGYKNLGLTAFTLYISGFPPYDDPLQGTLQGSIECYNNLRGYFRNGEPFIDPNTGKAVKFCVAGDPVAGTGWYEGPGWPDGPSAGDRRHIMASGSFTMAPGDTQEVVVAIVIAIGENNLDSITKLKEKSSEVQNHYNSTIVTNITISPNIFPISYELKQNYPNPFNPSTVISYHLQANSDVELTVYDVLGKKIVNIVNEKQNIGEYEINFDASNLTSGVYFYRLKVSGSDLGKAGSFIQTKKMLLLK